MKRLILITTLLTGMHAFAERDPDYFAGRLRDLKSFVALASPSCEKIYYVPKHYKVDSNLSSVFNISKDKKKSIVELTFAISPALDRDSSQMLAELYEYSKEVCPNQLPEILAYPDVLQDLIVEEATFDKSIAVSWVPIDKFRSAFRLRFDAQEVSVEKLLEQLRFFSPQQKIRFFRQIVDAHVELFSQYKAAAEWSEKWWTDKVCTTSNSSIHIAGIRFGPGPRESCKDIPRMNQFFKSAEYSSTFVFNRDVKPGVPEEKVNDLENELMSRLMRSLYIETGRREEADVVRMTFGVLKKQSSGSFNDHITLEHISENVYDSSIQIDQLAEFAEPLLRPIYKKITVPTKKRTKP